MADEDPGANDLARAGLRWETADALRGPIAVECAVERMFRMRPSGNAKNTRMQHQ